MNGDERQFEDFIHGIRFDDIPDQRHRDRLEQDLLRVLTKQLRHEQQSSKIWTIIMKNRITKLATAAIVLIAMLVGIHYLGGSIDCTNVTWGDVLEQIHDFRPYTCTFTVENEGLPAHSYHLMQFSLTRRREIRSDGTILVFDLTVPKSLTLIPEKKHAVERIYDMEPRNDPDLMELVRSMEKIASKGGGVQEIGVKKIDGQTAKGFRSLGKFNDITVWASVATKLPVRVEIIHVGLGKKIIITDFTFDIDLDEALFSATAPEGYTVEKIDEKAENSKLSEADLIEGLREVATLLHGRFPTGVELRDLQSDLREYIKQNNLSEPEIKGRLTSVVQKWRDADSYVRRLKKEMNVRYFHYAGNGVKLGETDKPIVWWLPKDSETCRVIYGDLSVRDVAPEELPK